MSSPKQRTLPMILGVTTGILVAGVIAASVGRPVKRSELPPVVSVQATWHAKVTNATGAARESPGATCQIAARIDYRRQAPRGVHEIIVTCDGIELYSQRAAAATSTPRTVTSDVTVEDGRLDFSFDEEGPRTRPHPYASIHTAGGIGLISGEAPRMSIVLAIEPGSKTP